MNLTLRRLVDEDAEIISHAFAEIGWNKPARQYRDYTQQQQTGQIIVLVAEWEDDFAGYLKIVWKPAYAYFKEQAIPEIQDLNVLPKYRRRGVATALMDAAEAIVARRSTHVGLGVGLHPGYNAAQRMYVLRGYIPDAQGVTWKDAYIQEGQALVADDELVLHLVKALHDEG